MYEAKSHISVPINSERSFALVFTVVFSLLGFHPLLNGGKPRNWMLIVAGVILLVGLVAPRLLATPNRLWFGVATVIGTVVSQVVMAVLFLLVLTPTGIIMRLFRRSGNRHGEARGAAMLTYWIPRGPNNNPMGSMRNQY